MATKEKVQMVRQEDGSIHVHVPAAVMYNLEQSQAVMRNVLGRLGCGGCHSGLQILFQAIEQEFVATEAGAVNSVG